MLLGPLCDLFVSLLFILECHIEEVQSMKGFILFNFWLDLLLEGFFRISFGLLRGLPTAENQVAGNGDSTNCEANKW